MRKFLIPAILLGAATIVAAPASAQYQGRHDNARFGHGYNNGQDIQMQIRQLDQQIQQMFSRNRISRNEARRLSNELQRIESRFRDYRRNGLNQREHHDLRQRIQNLRGDIREERREDRRDDRRDRRW